MATGPVTMNLQDSGDGMVPFGSPAPPPAEQYNNPPIISPSSRPMRENPNDGATFAVPPEPPKNPMHGIKNEQMMDSTPIDDVLAPEEMQGPPPQMMPTQMPQPQGAAAVMPQQAPQQQQKSAAPQNPMGLSDEHMLALVAAVASVAAFSNPVQEKLGTTIPNFLMDGDRSTTGLVVSGLVAAIIFYFTRRFALNKA